MVRKERLATRTKCIRLTEKVTIQIPLVIASKAKQSRHRINGKIQQNRDFTD